MPNISKYLPYFASGIVVKGFGRGSKQLGIPTANLSQDVVDKLPSDFGCGVYYGWASVNNGPVHKMVMSIGWNPFYNNEKKSMESYIIHQFDQDFYGSLLKITITGYLRPEKSFKSIDDLKAAIHEDVAQAESQLSKPEHYIFKTHSHFKPPNNNNESPSL